MLKENQIDIWHATLQNHGRASAKLEDILSGDERRKAQRFGIERDKARYVSAHAIVRMILAKYVSLTPQQLEFADNQWGKPQLRHPQCVDLQFNFTHSADQLLLAVSAVHPVGIDIEFCAPPAELLSVAAQCFSAEEMQMLINSHNQAETFFLCWTAKEAVAKAVGAGLSLDLKKIIVLQDAQHLVDRVPAAPISGLDSNVMLDQISLDNNYAAAIARVRNAGADDKKLFCNYYALTDLQF